MNAPCPICGKDIERGTRSVQRCSSCQSMLMWDRDKLVKNAPMRQASQGAALSEEPGSGAASAQAAVRETGAMAAAKRTGTMPAASKAPAAAATAAATAAVARAPAACATFRPRDRTPRASCTRRASARTRPRSPR